MTATPQTEPSSDGQTAVSRQDRAIRIGALVAVGVAVAFIAWLVLGRGERSNTQTAPVTLPATAPASPAASPSIVSLDKLRATATSSTVPIYWVGSRGNTKLELTTVPGSTVFLRYVSPAASAGDPRRVLTVATYERPKAFAEVERAAQSPTSKTIHLAGGGVAIYDPGRPTNVHLAYPGQTYQIEVYAPQRGLAVRLVRDGAVRPVD
jgi:hypothetical protein